MEKERRQATVTTTTTTTTVAARDGKHDRNPGKELGEVIARWEGEEMIGWMEL